MVLSLQSQRSSFTSGFSSSLKSGTGIVNHKDRESCYVQMYSHFMAPPGYQGGTYLSHLKQGGLSCDGSTGDESQLNCEKAKTHQIYS